MFRTTVQATERSDVDGAITALSARCEDAGLSQTLTDLLTSQARQVLGILVERGNQLASMGSQMRVTREISGEGYSVKIVFQCGQRRTLLQRLLDTLRRS